MADFPVGGCNLNAGGTHPRDKVARYFGQRRQFAEPLELLAKPPDRRQRIFATGDPFQPATQFCELLLQGLPGLLCCRQLLLDCLPGLRVYHRIAALPEQFLVAGGGRPDGHVGGGAAFE